MHQKQFKDEPAVSLTPALKVVCFKFLWGGFFLCFCFILGYFYVTSVIFCDLLYLYRSCLYNLRYLTGVSTVQRAGRVEGLKLLTVTVLSSVY